MRQSARLLISIQIPETFNLAHRLHLRPQTSDRCPPPSALKFQVSRAAPALCELCILLFKCIGSMWDIVA